MRAAIREDKRERRDLRKEEGYDFPGERLKDTERHARPRSTSPTPTFRLRGLEHCTLPKTRQLSSIGRQQPSVLTGQPLPFVFRHVRYSETTNKYFPESSHEIYTTHRAMSTMMRHVEAREVLSVSHDADTATIRSAYRAQALIHHPGASKRWVFGVTSSSFRGESRFLI